MTKRFLGFVSTLLLMSVSVQMCAAPGDLDISFNPLGSMPGAQQTALSRSQAINLPAVVQQDDKIVVVGIPMLGASFTATRIQPSGGIDGNFGAGGMVVVQIGGEGQQSEPRAVAQQPDGKIVIVGTGQVNTQAFIAVRLNIDGSLDASFGSGGVAIIPVGANLANANAVVVQPGDGKIIIAGKAQDGLQNNFVTVRLNVNGSLDGSFGSAGISVVNFGGSSEAYSVALQADGKIVVAGFVNDLFGRASCFAVTRLNINGSVDIAGFGASGLVILPLGIVLSEAYSVAVQSDGKIVVAGIVVDGATPDFEIVRLGTTGALDSSFGGGTGSIRIVIGSQSEAYAITLPPDGNIVAAGVARVGGVNDFAIVRLTSDGVLDTNFGSSGIKTITFGSSALANSVGQQSDGKLIVAGWVNAIDPVLTVVRLLSENQPPLDDAHAVAVQTDGKIVVAGYSFDGQNISGSLARVEEDGDLDTTFNVTGTQTLLVGSETGFDAVAIQPSDQKIVTAGYAISGGVTQSAVARWTTNGSLDEAGFGGGLGYVLTAVGSAARAYSAVTQGDGKIVVAGSGNGNELLVARYLSNGILDTAGFGGGLGYRTVALGTSAAAYSVALQSDGKILISGYSDGHCVVARFLSTGVLDTTFNALGSIPGVQELTFGTNFYGRSLAVQSNGKIVVGGYATIDGGQQFVVLRLNVDGTLDTTFGDLGYTSFVVGSDARAYSLVLQSDNKIVIAGDTYLGGKYRCAVARLTKNGIPDMSFGNCLGITTVGIGTESRARSVALQSDGKIVIAGLGDADQFAVARFCAQGVVSPVDEAYSVALQSDGKIVVAGFSFDGTSSTFAVARVLENGDLDTTFHVTGTQTVAIGTDAGARAVALQPDAKIVMAGYAVISDVYQFAVVKLLTDGSLDTSFGTGGIVTLPIGTEAVGRAVGIQEDGKIVVAGYAVVDGVRMFAIVRLLEGGMPDTEFGADGIITIQIGSDALGRALALTDDNKIVAAGYGYDGSGQFAVTRVWGKIIHPSMSLTSWLKTIYAEQLGYVPGDNTAMI